MGQRSPQNLDCNICISMWRRGGLEMKVIQPFRSCKGSSKCTMSYKSQRFSCTSEQYTVKKKTLPHANCGTLDANAWLTPCICIQRKIFCSIKTRTSPTCFQPPSTKFKNLLVEMAALQAFLYTWFWCRCSRCCY